MLFQMPEHLIVIGSGFKADNEALKFAPSIPLALTAYAAHVGAKILRPIENASNRVLYEWPGYWKLKARIVVSLIVCGTSSAAAILLWVFGKTWSDSSLGAVFALAVIEPVISASILWLAWIKIRELVEQ
jgi:hypothetical protein